MKIERIQDRHLIEFDKINPRKSKYSQMEKVTVLMREDQKHFLDYFCKVLKSKRISNKKNERITPNTIVRALLDFFIENHLDLDGSNIGIEEDLLKDLRKLITKNKKMPMIP